MVLIYADTVTSDLNGTHTITVKVIDEEDEVTELQIELLISLYEEEFDVVIPSYHTVKSEEPPKLTIDKISMFGEVIVKSDKKLVKPTNNTASAYIKYDEDLDEIKEKTGIGTRRRRRRLQSEEFVNGDRNKEDQIYKNINAGYIRIGNDLQKTVDFIIQKDNQQLTGYDFKWELVDF